MNLIYRHNDAQPDFTATQLQISKTLNIISLVAQILVLIAGVFNVWEFLVKRRITKCLIVLFYFAVFAVTIATASMSICVIYYDHDVDKYRNDLMILDVVKSTSLAVMYWTVGLSMF